LGRKRFVLKTIDYESEADLEAQIVWVRKAHPDCIINIQDINDGTWSYTGAFGNGLSKTWKYARSIQKK